MQSSIFVSFSKTRPKADLWVNVPQSAIYTLIYTMLNEHVWIYQMKWTVIIDYGIALNYSMLFLLYTRYPCFIIITWFQPIRFDVSFLRYILCIKRSTQMRFVSPGRLVTESLFYFQFALNFFVFIARRGPLSPITCFRACIIWIPAARSLPHSWNNRDIVKPVKWGKFTSFP